MLCWRFHSENEILVNCFLTQWKWTYILDLRSWRWSALNIGFVDKWPSRMQGQWLFQSRVGGQQFLVGSKKSWFSRRAAVPARIFLLQKVPGGELNVVLELLGPLVSTSHTLNFFSNLKHNVCMGPIVLNLGSTYARLAWPTHSRRIS